MPSSPIPPVVKGLSSGTAAFPSNAFTIGASSFSAVCSNSSVALSAPLPAKIATRFPAFRISAARRRSASFGSRAP